MKEKPTYITTAIAYINAAPHIGFLFELLSADIIKRYYLGSGDTFFLTGTDEHGIKIAEAAKAVGQDTQVFADQTSKKFEDLGKAFNISFDYFIRTSDSKHKRFVRERWIQLKEAGVLKKKKYSALYCKGCEAFKSGNEIKDSKCLIHEKELEVVEEENWFLTNVPERKAEIKNWIEKSLFPETRRQEVINIIDSGAYDEISVSRPRSKNSWGVEVPDDADQVMYVWVDALFNYLSGIELSGRKIEDVWPADVQVIGKDILKFHAIIWPALLLATGYDLPKKLVVHGFINVEGKKMSKSLGNVVTPQQLLDRYGVEGTRYLLFRQLNFYDDSSFSWPEFDAIYNGELANGVGNLLQRTVTLLNKFTENGSQQEVDIALNEDIEVDQPLKDLDFRGQLEAATYEINQANEWLTQNKPWEWQSPKRENISELVKQARLITISKLLEPFMPNTSTEIRNQLKTLTPKALFPRLEA